MVFSSTIFLLLYLPVFLLVYFLIPQKLKNIFILVSSISFYAWGAPSFIFLVLGSIIADFYVVRLMANVKGSARKRWLGLSVFMNIALLGYFKYANFFIDNVNGLLELIGVDAIQWVKIALPIGISFFTFQKITYTLDVFRRVYHPLKRVTDYMMYILMFPQLIAGPIVRFNEIAHQIEDRRYNESNNNRITGFFRFSIGLAKKVLIANVLGEQVDIIFSLNNGNPDTFSAWLGIVAYAFQIYYDFSGYSDMAIGLGRMIGFDFPENFNNPYISQNISEFWRRWHMTLGNFMKDYLYIPLGGNRVSVKRMYFNLWVVFLISGLWHGAAWNFVLWGAFHGLFLVADRLFLLKIYRKIGKIPSILITFFITLHGWVLFRAENLDLAVKYYKSLYDFDWLGIPDLLTRKVLIVLLVGFFFAFWGGISKIEKWQEKLFEKNKRHMTLTGLFIMAILLFVVSLSYVMSSDFNPFIYFRF